MSRAIDCTLPQKDMKGLPSLPFLAYLHMHCCEDPNRRTEAKRRPPLFSLVILLSLRKLRRLCCV